MKRYKSMILDNVLSTWTVQYNISLIFDIFNPQTMKSIERTGFTFFTL